MPTRDLAIRPSLAVLAVLSLCAGAAAQPLSRAPDGRALQLVFSDEFDSFRRLGEKPGIWRTTYGDGTQLGLDRRSLPTNAELEIYVDRDLKDAKGTIGLDPFAVHDGVLDIIASPTPVNLRSRLDNYAYVSGLISSQPSFSQTYGYFEMRAKLPAGKGLWPAFWLLPADLSWPPEIDVMECIGDPSHVYATTHTKAEPAPEIEAHISPEGFHTYAVSWDAKTISWYVDNRRIGSQVTPAELNKPMFMIANLAIGGNWAGTPDQNTSFPARMSIDFIRAYRFVPRRS
jgi:beta-glucanase (GH16 family)